MLIAEVEPISKKTIETTDVVDVGLKGNDDPSKPGKTETAATKSVSPDIKDKDSKLTTRKNDNTF